MVWINYGSSEGHSFFFDVGLYSYQFSLKQLDFARGFTRVNVDFFKQLLFFPLGTVLLFLDERYISFSIPIILNFMIGLVFKTRFYILLVNK